MYIIYCVIYPGRKSDVSSYPGRESDVSSVTVGSKHPVKRKWPEVDEMETVIKGERAFLRDPSSTLSS